MTFLQFLLPISASLVACRLTVLLPRIAVVEFCRCVMFPSCPSCFFLYFFVGCVSCLTCTSGAAFTPQLLSMVSLIIIIVNRSFGTGTVNSDRTELKKSEFYRSITSRLTNQTPVATASGKMVGTGGNPISSMTGQLLTSAEIEEVRASRAGHWTRISMLRKMQHVKCILRATSDGWQACLRDPIPPPRGHRPALDSVYYC